MWLIDIRTSPANVAWRSVLVYTNKIGELDLRLTGSLKIIRIGERMHNEACGKFGKNFMAMIGTTLGRTGWVFFRDKKKTNTDIII